MLQNLKSTIQINQIQIFLSNLYNFYNVTLVSLHVLTQIYKYFTILR